MGSNAIHNQLSALRQLSRVVADTGDLAAIEQFKPVDATTNPSLLFKAAQMPEHQALLQQLINKCPHQMTQSHQKTVHIADQFAIALGQYILERIEGKVSTEVDAHLSFDTEATIEKSRAIIANYRAKGIDTDRVLIKIAATWEGLEAAKQLTAEGIQCNLTLIFNLHQAVKAAQAGVYLISPFVGRLLDWHKEHAQFNDPDPLKDPGVQSVHRIFHYFKTHDHNTLIMGASFRHIQQIQALAGCDALTISPALLQELSEQNLPLSAALPSGIPPDLSDIQTDEPAFRWALNQDPAAHYLLGQGIRQFHQDYLALLNLIQQQVEMH